MLIILTKTRSVSKKTKQLTSFQNDFILKYSVAKTEVDIKADRINVSNHKPVTCKINLKGKVKINNNNQVETNLAEMNKSLTYIWKTRTHI